MEKDCEDSDLELISESMGLPIGKIRKELNIERLINSTHSSKDKINVFDFIFSLNYLAERGGRYRMFNSEIKFVVERIVSENPQQSDLWHLFDKLPVGHPSLFWSSLGELIIDKLLKNDPTVINMIFQKIHKESPVFKKYNYLKIENAFAHKEK